MGKAGGSNGGMLAVTPSGHTPWNTVRVSQPLTNRKAVPLHPSSCQHSVQPTLCQQKHFSEVQFRSIHSSLPTGYNLNLKSKNPQNWPLLILSIFWQSRSPSLIFLNVFTLCHYLPPPITPLPHTFHSHFLEALAIWPLHLGFLGLKCSFPGDTPGETLLMLWDHTLPFLPSFPVLDQCGSISFSAFCLYLS